MKLYGFQKLTLLDFPGHTAATVFTGGCNLRCPFCHNALLVESVNDLEEVDTEEVLRYLKKRQGILDGLAITGGEPLLNPDIRPFIEEVRALGMKIKLDTNGFYPDRLIELCKAGLIDYVAVDVKNTEEKYALTTGISSLNLDPFRKTVSFLIGGSVPYEFRTTVVAELHTVEDIGKIGQWIKGADRYFLQCFVDSGETIGSGFTAPSLETMKKMREAAAPFVSEIGIRGMDGV